MNNLKLLLFLITITFSVNLAAQTVYTTKTGEKYHSSSCRYLKYSKKEITLKKAKELGYQACKVCKPTANNTKASVTNNSLKTTNSTTTTNKRSYAVQCSGKTKAGARCKRRTKNASGRCYQH